MGLELQPYQPPPYDNRPNWGVIILTGVAALVLVISLGLLLQQMAKALEKVQPTITPTFIISRGEPTITPTPVAAAYALPITVNGTWEVITSVYLPDGTIEKFISTGEGIELERPEYTAPPQARVSQDIIYRLEYIYPDGAQVIEYWNEDRYWAKLEQTYYLLYDAANDPLIIVDENTLNAQYPDLSIIEETATPE